MKKYQKAHLHNTVSKYAAVKINNVIMLRCYVPSRGTSTLG